MQETSVTSGAPCHLLTLMPELRLEIASELGYFDLKQLGATCKANLDLVKSSALDQPLFRSRHSRYKLKQGTTVFLHPLLHLVTNFHINNVRDAKISVKKCDKVIPCVELAASLENATFPPCQHLEISGKVTTIYAKDHIEKLTAIGERGVTVQQVVEAVVRMWNRQWREEQEDGPALTVYEAAIDNWNTLNWMLWNGWDDCEVIGATSVRLVPNEVKYPPYDVSRGISIINGTFEIPNKWLGSAYGFGLIEYLENLEKESPSNNTETL